MHVCSLRSLFRSVCLAVCVAVMAFALMPPSAHASATPRDAVAVDSQFLQELESRAAQADPREQASIYADLADKISMLVAQQISAGELDAAEATLRHFESCTEKLKSGLAKDSKGLKRAEMLLHTTQRRLHDLARVSGGDLRSHVQAATSRLDSVQTALLEAVFKK